ncbi:Cell differentiation protein RCD1 -like protein [Capsicum annuum]|nr:Cell differentiation protein RCD1 -like protein [Capsicum annuum]
MVYSPQFLSLDVSGGGLDGGGCGGICAEGIGVRDISGASIGKGGINKRDFSRGYNGGATSSSSGAGAPTNEDRKMESIEQLVLNLNNLDLRENVLLELSKEIVSIYSVLAPPNLTPAQSNRVCNALALLQCVASHPDTRMLFLNAHIPLYLYPFLNTTSKSRPFEYLRLTSLGVIGALVKVDDTEVISFLLSTEIIPLCLRTMEMGSELSKTVATFIVQKILLDDVGLDYICTTAERFFAVARVLGNIVGALAEQPSSRAGDVLRTCLPDIPPSAVVFVRIQQRGGGCNNCFITLAGIGLLYRLEDLIICL